MNPTLLNIITGIFVISCVFSMLFVLIRTYFCYFTKSKKCSNDCSCDAIKEEKITYGEPMGYDDDVKVNVAIIPTAKKKPGRKKKVKEL